MGSRRAAAVMLLALMLAAAASADESLRDREMEECRSGEISTWGDGVDRAALAPTLAFAYDPAGAPAWFPREQVERAIERAAAAWSRCGVPARVVPWSADMPAASGLVPVRWSEEGSRGNFGLADFRHGTLSLGPGAFALLKSRNPAHDGGQTLQMVISHEMGHLFGLMAHSRRCVDVVSYYHDDKGGKCFTRMGPYVPGLGEYRASLPTACDIERCRRANGQPPLPGGRLPAPGPGD